jgi:hypothetical protein
MLKPNPRFRHNSQSSLHTRRFRSARYVSHALCLDRIDRHVRTYVSCLTVTLMIQAALSLDSFLLQRQACDNQPFRLPGAHLNSTRCDSTNQILEPRCPRCLPFEPRCPRV